MIDNLEDVKSFFKDHGIDKGGDAVFSSGETKRLTNLRLDWELSDSALNDLGDHTDVLVDLMFANLVVDLEDLLENGDTSKTQDALLKSFDGSVVRGRPLTHAEITGAQVFREYFKVKKSTEFTMYLTLWAEWGNSSQ